MTDNKNTPQENPLGKLVGEYLGDSNLMVFYRPNFDDLQIEEDSFSLTLKREEIDALKNFLNRIPQSEQ